MYNHSTHSHGPLWSHEQLISLLVTKLMKILCGQLNCSVKLADVLTGCSSHPQGKFYQTVKLSAKNLCLFHADSN